MKHSTEPNNFAKNLNLICTSTGWSTAYLAKEIGIPKSTLQYILNTGQTSLHTARRISQHLGIPLDTLVNDCISPQSINVTWALLYSLDCYSQLSSEDQQTVSGHIQAIVQLIQKKEETDVCV